MQVDFGRKHISDWLSCCVFVEWKLCSRDIQGQLEREDPVHPEIRANPEPLVPYQKRKRASSCAEE